ncbi:MAG: peptidyl-prolyl cis-trans isomerase, partial [Bacteroidales bacterium]|nr:peptidyl-prolyl cis-trans isomerase [Bacteroidales bacterium]
FVMVPFNVYGVDSTIVVSNDEIKAFYNSHKSFFKQVANRDIEYVVYEIKPSDEDIAATNEAMSNIYDEFTTTSNMKTFLLKNSDRPYSEYWFKDNSLNGVNSEINDFVTNNNAGASAIVRDGNVFYAARIMNVAQRSEEAYVKHILLQGEDAQATAETVLAAVKKGENFANLAAEYSADKGSADNGELGSIGTMTQDYMIPGFEGVFDAKVNEPYILNTSYGTHVVVVSEKSAPVTMKQVAILQKESIASRETINDYYAKANKFATMAAGSYANYKKAVDSLGVYSHPMNNVLESTTSYGAIDQAKELTRWVFEAKKGKVSNIITVNNNFFFIATLKDIHKEGYATVAEAAQSIRQQLYSDKVAEKTTKEVAEKIAGCTDIQAVAEKLGTTVSSQSDVTFTSLTSQALDPAFVGAASVAPEGKLVGPVKGSIGAYVFTVTGRDMGSYYTEDDAKTAAAQVNNYYVQTILPVMMNDADVKDNRARFY